MSKTTNLEHSSWKIVEAQSRRAVVYYQRSKLSKRDQATYISAVLAWALVVYDLLCSPSFDIAAAAAWIKIVLAYDCHTVSCFLKDIIMLLRNYVATDDSSVRFKHALEAKYGNMDGLISPVQGVLESFLEVPGAADFTVLNQFFSFITRVTLLDVGHADQALADYLKVEERLAKTSLDCNLTRELNTIMKQWMTELSFEDIVPSHASGAVAEPGVKSLQAKYDVMGDCDAILSYFLKKNTGMCQLHDPKPWYILELGNGTKLVRRCRLQFVPKSALAMRSISMEPALLMYYQQGCWRCIDRWLSNHKVLSRHIQLHDQTLNMEAARIGSKLPNRYATIDLSAASDSVSWELVKSVFRGTSYLAAGWATRSKSVLLPDGRTLPLLKFAPMGSALCFPTQCLIFAAVCEYVVRRYACNTACSLDYAVYGDDIVISSQVAEQLCSALESLGFVVNSTKSFTSMGLPFRESCGGEYYDGVDVSPLRIPRKFTGEKIDVATPSLFGEYCELANAAHSKHFKQLRLWIIHNLLELPRRFRPIFDGDGTSGLYSSQSTNFHLDMRWNEDWQVRETLCGTIKQGYVTDHEDEATRLFEWLRSAAGAKERPFWLSSTPRIAKVAGTRTRLAAAWRRDEEDVGVYPPLLAVASDERKS